MLQCLDKSPLVLMVKYIEVKLNMLLVIKVAILIVFLDTSETRMTDL